MDKLIYFIAVAPDDRLSSEIRTFSKDFADRFNSRKSFRNFPHITLVEPFKVSLDEENLLIERFKGIPTTVKPFKIYLEDFGSFNNSTKPVIFIKPKESASFDEILKDVRTHFGIKGSYNPHLTVAYKDLSSENYEKAWEEYSIKKYSAEFMVEKIGLYKHFNYKWNLVTELPLS